MSTSSTISRRLVAAGLAIGLLASVGLVAGCSSDDGAKNPEGEIALDTPKLTITKKDDGTIVKRYDTDADGTANIVETVRHVEDPNDPNVTQKLLVEKLVDVDGDGRFDILKEYDDDGVLRKEVTDDDLDGTKDRISFYSAETKSFSRKEIYGKNGDNVVAKRFYSGDLLDRVEKDTNSDGTFDLFEYYSGGEIDRIGLDENNDGEVDRWRHREREQTAERTETSMPEPSVSGGGGSESESSGESESEESVGEEGSPDNGG
jgi:hypothetical protein